MSSSICIESVNKKAFAKEQTTYAISAPNIITMELDYLI